VSNVEARPREASGGREAAGGPVHEMLPGREVVLGGTRGIAVSRTLPHRDRRMVGAWCFVDQYGPHDTTSGAGMRVPPHPHTGLQTVSWLVQGEVLHQDSLGSVQLIRPGQLNLMTAGRGIAHSEESPPQRSPLLQGVQLWVALPGPYRGMDPAFAHHPDLPVLADDGVSVTVIVGELAGVTSPAAAYSPLVGVEIALAGGAGTRLTLRPDFEYAALVLDGAAEVDSVTLAPGTMLYLGRGRDELPVRGSGRVLLLGGEPFEERIVMWWNFVGRDHNDIVRDREDWRSGARFGPVPGFGGDPLPAPPMPATPLLPLGRER
jgi:redox-sensitive bicupin YhaK (pirin superfamily)